MVICNALPRKEYEIIFMCNTEKEIWKTLLITHQGNSQVKDNKIDLLVQQYEQFVIFEDESIDSAFARFNTIITSLKALDEGYSSKNYVRKFLRALHPKWRAKVTAIEDSKDLTSLSLDELIGNLKVHEMIIKKDSEIVKAKGERKSLALKAKKEYSDEESSTSNGDDKNGKSDRKCFRCRDLNHPIGECSKPPRDKNKKGFIEGTWSDSGEEDNEKAKDETCLMAHASSELLPRIHQMHCTDPGDGGSVGRTIYRLAGFARFNIIIASLKALDEGFSSKNYVRKFLKALHPKWRTKVTAIEESKDLSSLALDWLIDNLKVHKVVMKKDSKIYKGKKERIKSIALKAKKESSDDETLTSGSDDEEYAMAVRNFKKFFRRKGKFVRQPREERKSSRQRDEKKGKSDRTCFRCEIEIACKSCDELKSENVKLKETQVKFVKFNKSANTLREMLDTQKLSSCKIDLGFDNSKASTSRTKIMSFVGSSAENAMDGSTIRGHGSTIPGSVSRNDDQKGTEHVFSPPLSSRLDFVINRKKVIHNSIDVSKKPSLKLSLKSGIGYVKTESRSKTPPPKRNISS
ncbi:hypothetical protein Tco_0626363 [Tanacetum coccineum]|uniref:Zf-CCHC domain-containing protein/UBN2 domain-containing protein n=1 Tax=Tanacetum coccineum TaxID=301880 RepID=A0ABQ4WJG7_9ASTR